MSSDPGFDRFHDFFTTKLELTVEVIPRTNEKTADAFVNGESPGYAVELKARCNRENFASDLTKGDPFGVIEKPDFDGWVIKQARDALKQLASNDPLHSRIWVMWIDTTGRTETGLGFEQVVGTVFGIQKCMDWQFKGYECIQAHYSLFEQFPKLDIIVVRDAGMALCVDEESVRFGVISSSKLFKHFASLGDVFTVSSLQQQQHGYLAIDPNVVDRTLESSVQEYFEKAYNLRGVQMCDIRSYVYSMQLPPRVPMGTGS